MQSLILGCFRGAFDLSPAWNTAELVRQHGNLVITKVGYADMHCEAWLTDREHVKILTMDDAKKLLEKVSFVKYCAASACHT